MSDPKTSATTKSNVKLKPSEHICGTCEYFDHGAMGPDGHSDCHNRLSPRFQTYATQTCIHWVQCT